MDLFSPAEFCQRNLADGWLVAFERTEKFAGRRRFKVNHAIIAGIETVVRITWAVNKQVICNSEFGLGI